MNPREFENLVRFLRNTYGLKSYIQDGEIMDFLYDQCGRIPVEAVQFIKERFVATYDKFPGKLHNAILDVYAQWLNAHPSKKAMSQDRGCRFDHCTGGYLHIRWKDEGGRWEGIARCTECGRAPSREYLLDLNPETVGKNGSRYQWNTLEDRAEWFAAKDDDGTSAPETMERKRLPRRDVYDFDYDDEPPF